jgi:hypothetical protein
MRWSAARNASSAFAGAAANTTAPIVAPTPSGAPASPSTEAWTAEGEGVRDTLPQPLSPEEENALHRSARVVRDALDGLDHA